MQCPSTKAAMLRQKERDPKDDLLYATRPIPKNYLAVPDAKSLDELVACRPITYEESKVYNKLRYERGKHIAMARGEKDAVSAPEEKKKSAINAFMDIFSPSVIRAKFKDLMVELIQPSHAEIMAEEVRKMRKDK